MILGDIFLRFFCQVFMVINIGDQEERSARFEHTTHFFQIFLWVRLEIKAFNCRDFIKGCIVKRKLFD